MRNTQHINKKHIRMETKIISDELGLDPETSKKLLLLHGSVKRAIDAYTENNNDSSQTQA